MLEAVEVDCPYCGEYFETSVDLSAGAQRYVEDCQVCCSPIVFDVRVGPEGELTGISTERENP